MLQRLIATAALALLGLASAGCSTTGGAEYSSLPPSPEHPPASVIPEPVATIPGFHGRYEGPALPPEQYPDLLDRVRAGYALPDAQHYAVDREIAWYQQRPDFLDRTFRRGSRYLHYIVTEIEKRGLPLELALLPVVESAFNPVAYSRSRAAGLWQFIPSTGKHYGLTQNWWIDERRDVIRAYGVWHRLGIVTWNRARPAAFLIDPDSSIRASWIGDNQTQFPSAEEILAVLGAKPRQQHP